MSFEGTLNGTVFLYFLDHFLCPLLQPGQWVVLDNVSAHKVAGVRERIEATGAHLLYLPPYSPEYNPIELAWSKIKGLLRSAKARSVDALYQAFAEALEAISTTDAQGFSRQAKMSST